LEDAGYPLISEITDGTTYWKLEPSFKGVLPVTFTLNELMALYSSKKLIISHIRSPFHTELESAFKKIETALPAKHVARLEKIEEIFTPLVKASKKIDLNKGLFETVQWALLNQNALKVEYKPRKGNRAFPFEAHLYSLLFYKGEFYLLCLVPGKGMRHFALEGIKKAERMKERFEIPEDFSISEFLKVPFGMFREKPISVKVIFDKELSDYIQRRSWHPSQKIKELQDGRIFLTMTASGKEEIKAWILSFGAKAKVISPQSLQEEIKASISQALTQYTYIRPANKSSNTSHLRSDRSHVHNLRTVQDVRKEGVPTQLRSEIQLPSHCPHNKRRFVNRQCLRDSKESGSEGLAQKIPGRGDQRKGLQPPHL
jgi:predicted DNA-binding transcriptional regulator YafY